MKSSLSSKDVQAGSAGFGVRDATPSDAGDLSTLYGRHVAEGSGTFEEIAPTTEEILRRYHNVRARGLPWLVAEAEGRIIGYSYASPYHQRSAYRFSVQSSTYVDPDWHRMGVGLTLLNEIIIRCEKLGYRQLVAAIGDSLNEAALRLHARAGFRTIGHAVKVGVKFGRWTDVVYVQRALGDPIGPPPREDPLGYVWPTDQTGP